MSPPNVARTGLVVLIAISVALWFSAVPAAAQAGDDGGLGLDVGADGVQIGGDDGINVSLEDPSGAGSIDGGGGGAAVNVTAGGDDGFLGGGGGNADVGTDGINVSTNGGGGDAQGNIVTDFELGLDADTDGNVSGIGEGTVEVLGEGGTFGCEFDTAGETPSAEDCQFPGSGDEEGSSPIDEFPNPIEEMPNPIEEMPNPLEDLTSIIQDQMEM